MEETLEFDRAVALARSKLSEEDTLIVVSADHSHTMTYAGYGVKTLEMCSDAGNGFSFEISFMKYRIVVQTFSDSAVMVKTTCHLWLSPMRMDRDIHNIQPVKVDST